MAGSFKTESQPAKESWLHWSREHDSMEHLLCWPFTKHLLSCLFGIPMHCLVEWNQFIENKTFVEPSVYPLSLKFSVFQEIDGDGTRDSVTGWEGKQIPPTKRTGSLYKHTSQSVLLNHSSITKRCPLFYNCFTM